jgi:hypothetical protein
VGVLDTGFSARMRGVAVDRTVIISGISYGAKGLYVLLCLLAYNDEVIMIPSDAETAGYVQELRAGGFIGEALYRCVMGGVTIDSRYVCGVDGVPDIRITIST